MKMLTHLRQRENYQKYLDTCSLPVSPKSMASSLAAVMPGMISTEVTVRNKGMRITQKSSDLVLDIWAIISLQQMLANTVPERRNRQHGSSSRILLGDQKTQMKHTTMAMRVETRGLIASKNVRFLPVPFNDKYYILYSIPAVLTSLYACLIL